MIQQFIEEARRMVQMNSVTANGNEELANYALSLMKERGLKASLQPVMHSLENVSKRQFNVIGILGDPLVDKKTRKGLLLNTHLDTVGPGLPENWTETGGDPFSATIRDGKIFGLGTADVKLDFLCKLHAVEKFREKKLKMPVYLVGTCGEELGMFGTKYLIKSMALNPKFVLVGEPSNLRVVYAHKCLNIFRVSIGFQLMERDARGFNRRIDLYSFGKSAHSSYPHLGINAILRLIEFLKIASENGFEIRYTHMQGGDTVNKVPDSARVEFYLSSHQFEDFKRFFRETAKIEEMAKAFRADLGGLGESGVRFLPDVIFPCLTDITQFFKGLSSSFEQLQDASYNPPYSTVNLGQLKQRLGGLDLYFDLRVLPYISPAEIEAQIQKGIQLIACNYPNLNISVVRERMNPGLNMTEEYELVRIATEALRDSGIAQKLDKKATSTEAAQYFQAGYESVVFGPGVSQGNSHSPNEHNLMDHLEKAVAFYEKVIEKVCL